MTDTKDLLLDAAEAGMRQKGYNAVSFRDLAEQLGIKSASVHYHFPRKEDLGRAMIARYSARFFAALDGHADGAGSPREKIAALCATYREALVASDAICLGGMLGAEACGLPDALAEDVAGFFKANMAWCKAAFPDEWSAADKDARADLVVSALQGSMMLASNLDDVAVFDRTANLLLSDMFGG